MISVSWATPTVPKPFAAAPMMPATAVPWELVETPNESCLPDSKSKSRS
jgi:hypothetical protein